MITLITGAPGSGKTLLLVAELLQDAQAAGRQIVCDGIPDLVVEHEPAQEVSAWTKVVEDQSSQDGKKLLFNFPQGALVVVDECQRVFRPRKAGASVPPEVAAFETHRHQGLDFILITQHPGLLDQNVRRLVGRHIHIRDLGFLGRWVYEFPEATDPERYKVAPVKRKWSLPKKAFNLYKSSSLHIKPKRGFPTALKVLAVSLVLLAIGVSYAWQSINKKLHPEPPKTAAFSSSSPSSVGLPSAAPVTTDSLIESMAPRLRDFPESAPMYDQLRQVKNMPLVVGCIQTKKGCTCQHQQGNNIEVSDAFCKQYLVNAHFDPYRERSVPQIAPQGQKDNKQNGSGQPAPVESAPSVPGVPLGGGGGPAIGPGTPSLTAS